MTSKNKVLLSLGKTNEFILGYLKRLGRQKSIGGNKIKSINIFKCLSTFVTHERFLDTQNLHNSMLYGEILSLNK